MSMTFEIVTIQRQFIDVITSIASSTSCSWLPPQIQKRLQIWKLWWFSKYICKFT